MRHANMAAHADKKFPNMIILPALKSVLWVKKYIAEKKTTVFCGVRESPQLISTSIVNGMVKARRARRGV